ncbi:MAG: tetratricopeptide repeat protein [Candidatus Promineifilaceae bacterium]
MTGGSRAALPRQQTLCAALDWSYDLLESDEQTLFRHLSVFAGGFTLAAAEAVCLDSSSLVLDSLTRLVDKSLVVATGPRYQLLTTIRQYGLDKLWLSGEETHVRQRHLAWFTQLALHASQALLTDKQQSWLDELGDYTVAETVLQEGLHLYRGLGDKAGVAFVLHHLGWLNTAVKRFAAAHAYHQESLTLRRELGPVAQRDVAESLTYLGLLAWCEGNLVAARAYQEEALALKQALSEPWAINFSRWNLSNVALAEGQLAEAERLYRQCLQALADLRERWGLPSVLESLGTIALTKQQWERMAILYAAAEKIRAQTGSPLPWVWQEARASTLETVRTMMGETAFVAAFPCSPIHHSPFTIHHSPFTIYNF